MPMAGRGLRFKNYGYNTPKPLIKINKHSMFVNSSNSFPRSLGWIFIIQKSLKKNKLFKKSMNFIKNKKLILLNKLTNGQASSAFKAIKFINKNQIIIVHSCDLKFEVNMAEIKKKIKKYDIIVFTAKSQSYHLTNEKQFSWVKKNELNNEIEISCKKNFKNKKKKSRVLVGSFVFKNKDTLIKSIKYVFKKKLKIKNEYYLDMVAASSKKAGYKTGEIVVKKYVSWGSHGELSNFKLKR